MRFETIYIAGFGCLRDVTFKLAPGLNVFYGANEAGKSTLQQAIWALLYGFYKGDRKQTKESEYLQRYRPWEGDAYGGHLVYFLDGGKSYKVVRDFDDGNLQTSVCEADTGRDITNTFDRGKLGRVSFAHKHFSMSEEVFINTCFVRQADLHRLADAAQEITETIVNLSGTGNQDRSVKRALELLEEAFREQVGTARARTKPLLVAQEKLAKLKREKQDILARRSAMEMDYQRRAQLLDRKGEISQDMARLQYLLTVTQRDQLGGRIQSIETLMSQKLGLEGQIERSREVADFELGQRDAVSRLFQEWINCRDALAKTKGEVESSREELVELKRQRQTLIDELRPLETSRDISLDQESVIRDLERHWRGETLAVERAKNALRLAQAQVDELLGLRDLARQSEMLAEARPQALHDFKLKWEAAESDVSTATEELKTAEQTGEAQPLSFESYEQLHSHFSAFSFEALSALKERDAALKQSVRQTSAGVPLPLWGLLLIVGCAGFVAGLALIVVALISRSQALAIVAMGALGLGVVAGTTGLIQRRRGMKLQETVEATSKGLTADLEKIGCKTVGELETSYHAYLEAQAPFERLTRAQLALRGKQETLAKIIAEGRMLMGLEEEATLTLADVVAAEKKARQFAEQLEELGNRERQRDRASQTWQQAKETLSGPEENLRAALVAVRLDGGDLARDIGRFYELCKSRQKLEKLESDQRAVNARLEQHDAREASVRGATIALEGAQSQLQRILRQIGIREDDSEKAFRIFQSRCEQAETLRQDRQTVAALAREAQAVLGGQTLEQCKQQHEALSRTAQVTLASAPGLKGLMTDDSLTTLRSQLDDIRQEEGTVATELAGIEARINVAWSGVRPLAEVEEDTQVADVTIASLEFHGRALGLAIEQLTAAADEHHRNFLPRLNQTVGQSFSRVTAGRYKDVQIDHADLQVRLRVPNLPNPITPEVLSRGAQEQIYLLLRLGLTELMSSGRERLPLVLDDPLVNYDADRLVRSLDFLAEMAKQTQVLIFTKDEGTANWFQSRHAGAATHRLHKL